MKIIVAALTAAALAGCVGPGYRDSRYRYSDDRHPVYGYSERHPDYRHRRDYDYRNDRDYRERGAQNTITEKQHNQRERIEGGVESGELTRKEAQRLREQQRNIKGMRQNARDDGVVTGKERQRIKKAQNKASDKIYDQKHDDQER